MLIDKLLHADVEEIKAMPKGEVELPRWKEKFGEGTIKVQGISAERLKEIREMNIQHGKDGDKVDEIGAAAEMIVEGVIEPNFRDSRLLEKFHTQDPSEIVRAVFQPGEMGKINKKILELCGIEMKDNSQEKVDNEIKNL